MMHDFAEKLMAEISHFIKQEIAYALAPTDQNFERKEEAATLTIDALHDYINYRIETYSK